MRDLSLNDFSNELWDELSQRDINLPRRLVYQLTKAFFVHAERTAAKGNERFIIHNRDLTQVYPLWDVKALCNELANGEKVLTADHLIKRNKMQKNVLRHYKKMPLTLQKF